MQEVFLEGAGLDEIVNAHRMLLAQTMEAADALLDFHGIPRQVEIDQATGKLEVPPLGAAVGQEQGAAALAELLGDGLALRRRGSRR